MADLYTSKRSKIKNFKATVTNNSDNNVDVSTSLLFADQVKGLNSKRKSICGDLDIIIKRLSSFESNKEIDDDLQGAFKRLNKSFKTVRKSFRDSLVTLTKSAINSYDDFQDQMKNFYLSHPELWADHQNGNKSGASAEESGDSDGN